MISTTQLDRYVTNGRYTDAAMAMLQQIRHAFGFWDGAGDNFEAHDGRHLLG